MRTVRRSSECSTHSPTEGGWRSLRGKSPEWDSNPQPRLYKSRALPIELSGQFIVAGPADPFLLSVSGGGDPQPTIGGWDIVDGHSIDLLRIRAVDKKYLNLAGVPAEVSPTTVRASASSRKPDNAISKAALLALHPHKLAIHVEHKVVPLIRAEREKHLIATPDQLSEDRGFRAKAHIDRV
jgi:hypothetical protein